MLVPPVFAAPIPLDIGIFMAVEENWSTERKYVEKRVIVKVVDGCTGRADRNPTRQNDFRRPWS